MRSLTAVAIWLLATAIAPASRITSSPEAMATVVIYNRKDPKSESLARYYAGKRGIPETQLVGLACSIEEEISRDEYLVDIEAPLRDVFTKRGWWEVVRDPERGHRYVANASMRFVALIRGIPIKIRSDVREQKTPNADIQPGNPMGTLLQHNEAAVDSELAAMFTLLEEAPSVIPNTYYRRLARILTISPTGSPLLVCRLDGPSDAIVRQMIDDAIAAEQSGLWGWAYLDARNIKAGPYAEGDEWITRAGEMMRKKGIPVISDYAPEVFPMGFPITDAAIYYGWYEGDVAGPFLDPTFKFLPGTVAVHLHSFSARTIRSPNIAWAAPLLARGATATMGNVYEPYLALTVNFDILQDRLMSGLTLAESAYSATRGLSWMCVVLGDPLYRPYARWNAFDFEQPGSDNIWQRYRKVVLAADGSPLAAADDLRALAAEAGNSMPLEALGQAQAAANQFDDALRTLASAAKVEKSRTIRFRLTLERIEILRRAGRPAEALQIISDALGDFRSDAQQTALGRITLILRPPPLPSSTPLPSPGKK